MKTFIFGLFALASFSTFASEYQGVDQNGKECSIKVYKMENGTIAVNAITESIWPQTFEKSAKIKKNKLVISNTNLQGNESVSIRTTDRVEVLFEGHRPTQFTVNRTVKVKKGFAPATVEEKAQVECELK